MSRKLNRLLKEFRFSTMETVYPFARQSAVQAAANLGQA
jgi:hypothetical protein